MSVYKFHSLDGGDWTIQKDSENLIQGSSTAQATAANIAGKVLVQTYYPYYQTLINLNNSTIEINDVDVTSDGAAAIVEQLNEEVFTGPASGGGPQNFQQVLETGKVLTSDHIVTLIDKFFSVQSGDPDFAGAVSYIYIGPLRTTLFNQDANGFSARLDVQGNNLNLTKDGGTVKPMQPISINDDFANDAAAAAGGVAVGELYHTSGVVKIRLV